MPDEEIDKLVKDAANQHHPPYDDTAWGKMEILLDKHLPQKKDRKRPIIFLLLFLLLGGGFLFFILENAQHKSTATIASSQDNKTPAGTTGATTGASSTGTATSITPGAAQPADDTNISSASNGNTLKQQQDATDATSVTAAKTGFSTGKTRMQVKTPQAETDDSNTEQYSSNKNNNRDQKGRLKIKVKSPGTADVDDVVQKQKTGAVKTATDEPAEETVAANTDNVSKEPKNNDADKTTGKKNDVIKTDSSRVVKTEQVTTKDSDKTTASSTTKQKKKSLTSNIAITVSGGADLSYVESISNAGKVKPVVGAGLSYSFAKHFIVSSGLYVSKKIYTASPYQYKFTGYTPNNLKEIGADCKVYEIPVSVYYATKQKKNHNWLVGAGLSSLLMKKEDYDYRYQTPTGQTYNYQTTISNQNKHYFSVLTLSGGYQYKLNNNLSFIAEPYIKLPLTGIGAGKIKLNSTGVMVTAAIKPFAKKKK